MGRSVSSHAVAAALADCAYGRLHFVAPAVLSTIIPADVVAWVHLDFGKRTADVSGLDHGRAEQAFTEGLGATCLRDPVVRSYLADAVHPTPRRMSDVASDVEWFENPSYREAFSLIRARRTLSIVVELNAEPAGMGWMFLRSGRDFTDDEVRAARELQGALTALERVDRRHRSCKPVPASASMPALTVREREVLIVLASGRSAAQIARELGVKTGTVNKHLEHVYAKLGVHDRVSALNAAREHGVL